MPHSVVPNSETWTQTPVVQTLRVSEYRCQCVSITAEDDCLAIRSYYRIDSSSSACWNINLQ